MEWNLRYATTDRIRAAGAWWQIKEVGASNDPNVPYIINGEQARGYWIVQVPKEIINGHGGIFNESAIDFIAGLYKLCRAEIRAQRSVRLAPVSARSALEENRRRQKRRGVEKAEGQMRLRGAFHAPGARRAEEQRKRGERAQTPEWQKAQRDPGDHEESGPKRRNCCKSRASGDGNIVASVRTFAARSSDASRKLLACRIASTRRQIGSEKSAMRNASGHVNSPAWTP